MKSNGFETDQVMAAGDGAGDCRGPSVVVGNHATGSPGTRADSTRDEAGMVNLELEDKRSKKPALICENCNPAYPFEAI